MKPTNFDNESCDPISSNCVIWNGPDIPCIKLCKGDSVSIVVFKLATELCKVLDILNIDAYDLSCFNLTSCAPANFVQLINFLIARVCEANGITPPPATGGCPDCIVNIAPCFYYQNPQGDTETTMQLVDYVTAIGNRICGLISDIDTINSILESYNIRITALENKPKSTVTLPLVTPVCVTSTPGQAQEMSVVLAALERAFCELLNATGTAVEIFSAINQQCAGLNNLPQLAGPGTMSTIPGWNPAPGNAAAAINNVWLTICDMRAAVANILINCCPNGCDGIQIMMTASVDENDQNLITLLFTGSIPPGFTQCNPAGTTVTISDESGGSTTILVPVAAYLNNPSGYEVDLSATSVNTSENLLITAQLCFEDSSTGTQCQSVINYVMTNTLNCPDMQITPGLNDIAYTVTWTGSVASVDVQLYDASGTTLIASQVSAVTGPTVISNSFTGLTYGTTYKIRVVVTINSSVTTCPFYSVTTLPQPCLAPTGPVTANIV